MPNMHIHTIEEQESQESWISLMMDNDEPMFWLNTLKTSEETDLVPSEPEMWILLRPSPLATVNLRLAGNRLEQTGSQ